jgi:hypothetical protein
MTLNDVIEAYKNDPQNHFNDEEKAFFEDRKDFVDEHYGQYEWEPISISECCYCACKEAGKYIVAKYNFRTGEHYYDKEFKTFNSMVRFYSASLKA